MRGNMRRGNANNIDVRKVKAHITRVQARLTALRAAGGSSDEEIALRREATDLCAVRRLAKGAEHLYGYRLSPEFIELFRGRSDGRSERQNGAKNYANK